MSVLIKDMEMPKSCYECKLDIRTDVCLAFSEWNKEHPYSIRATDRLPDCPLSEVPFSQPEQQSRIEKELHGLTPKQQYNFLDNLMHKKSVGWNSTALYVTAWLAGEED